ncbi:hypothetical protein BLOT_012384 [Blomia tropicalis]|nr:hypothetical protein BLOT_012384 [Blomia tropicalis]
MDFEEYFVDNLSDVSDVCSDSESDTEVEVCLSQLSNCRISSQHQDDSDSDESHIEDMDLDVDEEEWNSKNTVPSCFQFVACPGFLRTSLCRNKSLSTSK